MNKTFKLIILCLVILFASGILFVLYRGGTFSIINPVSEIISTGIKTVSCTGSARAAIEAKNLQDIHFCNVENFDIEGEEFDYMSISYGPGMDCPAGCIYAHYEGLVDSEGKVYDFYALPNPFYALVSKYGTVCASFDYGKNDLPHYQRRIIRDGKTFHWQLVFQNLDAKQTRKDSGYYADYQCIINGKLDFLSSSSNYFDDSQLTVRPLYPDCLTLTDNQKRGLCLLEDARIKQDVSLCIKYVSADSCYSAVALSALDESLCKNIGDDYTRGRCYLGIAQEKREVKICQNIPRDFERGQCIESVEKFLGTFDPNYDHKKNIELRDRALQESNYILCSQIRYNESLKTECYTNVAVKSKDEVICKQIIDEYWGPACIRDVRKGQ